MREPPYLGRRKTFCTKNEFYYVLLLFLENQEDNGQGMKSEDDIGNRTLMQTDKQKIEHVCSIAAISELQRSGCKAMAKPRVVADCQHGDPMQLNMAHYEMK